MSYKQPSIPFATKSFICYKLLSITTKHVSMIINLKIIHELISIIFYWQFLYSQYSSIPQTQNISFFFHSIFCLHSWVKKSCFRPVASTTICYFCGEKKSPLNKFLSIILWVQKISFNLLHLLTSYKMFEIVCCPWMALNISLIR